MEIGVLDAIRINLHIKRYLFEAASILGIIMSNPKSKIYYPKFYSEFSCIGPACENDCCHTWWISIDRETYTSYCQSSDPFIQKVTAQMTAPERVSDLEYRRITLNSNGRCPLQNADGSCHVHKEHGEEMLSRTCKTYPRILRNIGGRIEPSLSLSCPEAASEAPAGSRISLRRSFYGKYVK